MQEAGGRSTANCTRTDPADHLLQPRGDLLAASRRGPDDHGHSIYNGWPMEDVWLDKIVPALLSRAIGIRVEK